jgi:hypothetical protein
MIATYKKAVDSIGKQAWYMTSGVIYIVEILGAQMSTWPKEININGSKYSEDQKITAYGIETVSVMVHIIDSGIKDHWIPWNWLHFEPINPDRLFRNY